MIDFDWYNVKDEEELQQKMKEHLGEHEGQCAWGRTDVEDGGYLGAARKRVAELEEQLVQDE